MDNELERLRKQINFYDDLILEYLNNRIKICQQIGEYKRENNLSIYNQDREQEIINRLSSNESYPGLVSSIWPIIMTYSKTVQ